MWSAILDYPLNYVETDNIVGTCFSFPFVIVSFLYASSYSFLWLDVVTGCRSEDLS
jgi:hypothetical protein